MPLGLGDKLDMCMERAVGGEKGSDWGCLLGFWMDDTSFYWDGGGAYFGSRAGNHELSFGNAEVGVAYKRYKPRSRQVGNSIYDYLAQRGGQG